MPNYFLRLVYVAEFLLAVIAVLSLWSQVGGQDHLDLMPWYLKLALTAGMALIVVMGTVAAMSHPDAWNAKTIAFLILGILIACAMGAVTYYYHLHEDDEDNDNTSPAVAGPARSGVRALSVKPKGCGAHMQTSQEPFRAALRFARVPKKESRP